MTCFGVELDQCPTAWLAAQRHDILDLIRDVQTFKRVSVLPDAGGWLDQHPHWTQAENIISAVMMSDGKDSNPKR